MRPRVCARLFQLVAAGALTSSLFLPAAVPVAAADPVALRAGTTQDLVVTNPIGAYVGRGTCSVTLDLVHIVRPQG